MASTAPDTASAAAEAAPSTALFFALTYAISTLALLPPSLATLGVIDGRAEDLLAGAPLAIFGPAVAAMFAAYREGGRARVRALLAGLGAWRVGPAWLLLPLVLPTLIFLPVRFAYGLATGGEGGPYLWPPGDAQHAVAALLVPIGEEIGWRGFAQPRLVARHGPVRASLILGLLWGAWHVPLFLAVGTTDPAYYALMLPYFVAGAVMFTWFHQRAGGSLLVAVLLHVGVHLHNPNQAPPGDLVPITLSAVAYVVLAGALLALDRAAFTPASSRS